MDRFDLLEAVADSVSHKQLKRKSDGREFLLYTVETNQGSFTTAKRDLAQQAEALIGRPATWHVKTEQRGEFTNYYLESVEPIANGAAQEPSSSFHQPAAYGSSLTPVGASLPPVPAATPPVFAPPKPVGESAGAGTKDVFIFRQTAAKVAAQISSGPVEFWSNMDDLVEYFKTGTKPGAEKAPAQAAKNEYIPEAALSAPDTSGPQYAHSDDDIPF